jgi:predicted outer membrane protein
MFFGSALAAAIAVAVVSAPAVGAPNGGDQEIVSQLHLANQLAIEAAQLAQARATDVKVQALAATLEHDHRVADLNLLTYAELKQMSLSFVGRPGAVLPAHDALALADLKQSPAARFDYDFATQVVTRQQAVIDEAVSARRIAHDPLLAGLIDGALSTMRRHLAEAETVRAALPEPSPPPLVSPAPLAPGS